MKILRTLTIIIYTVIFLNMMYVSFMDSYRFIQIEVVFINGTVGKYFIREDFFGDKINCKNKHLSDNGCINTRQGKICGIRLIKPHTPNIF